MTSRNCLTLGFLAFVIAFVSVASAAYTPPPCEDGTPYYQCSEKNPGYLCLASGLIFDDRPAGCCAKSGGTLRGNECVIACPDGTKHGQCSTSNQYGPPYYCNLGKLEKNTNLCQCPDNYDKVGNDCELKKGCAYDNPKCVEGQICDKLQNKCVSLCDEQTSVYNKQTGKCEPLKPASQQEQSNTQQKTEEPKKTEKTNDLDALLSNSLGTVNTSSSNNTSQKAEKAGANACCGSTALILATVGIATVTATRKKNH